MKSTIKYFDYVSYFAYSIDAGQLINLLQYVRFRSYRRSYRVIRVIHSAAAARRHQRHRAAPSRLSALRAALQSDADTRAAHSLLRGSCSRSARAPNPSPLDALPLFLSLFFSLPDGHDARSVATFVRPRGLSSNYQPLLPRLSRRVLVRRRFLDARTHTYIRNVHTLVARLSPFLPPVPLDPFHPPERAENSLCSGYPVSNR